MSGLFAPVLAAGALLLLGLAMVRRAPLLRAWFIPASVAGGLLGLALFQGTRFIEPVAPTVEGIAASLRGWPGPLLAVVFAGLLLERPRRRLAESARGAALCAITVWVIVLGEITIGLIATGLIIQPVHDEVPAAFGQLLEVGFAGGHGTAAAMGAIYRDALDFPEGLDLALFVATVGLVYSVASGICMVNIGARLGWTRSARRASSDITPARQSPRVDAARASVQPRALARSFKPMALQIALLALAVLTGWALQSGFIRLVELGGETTSHLRNIPLFLFTLIGGWLLRHALTRLGAADLIDAAALKRLVGAAMEFLIVAAVASMRLEAVVSYAWPILLLIGLGCVWAIACLVWLSPRLLPRERWFEVGLINYGMSTGTTAQGMMLLRLVDPDLESGAAEEYALAAPFSAPFVGGGIVTLSLPFVLKQAGSGPVVGVLLLAMAGLYLLGRRLRASAERRSP